MCREALILTIMAFCSAASAANFTGDAEFVAAAEKARVTSAVFWTGKPIKDWDSPCPIEWDTSKPNGAITGFSFNGNKATVTHVVVNGSRQEVILNAIPHEVDHMVRISIIGRPVPRWLDEGCAVQFESEEAKAGYRSALLHGNLKTTVWDLMGAKEYPRDSETLTAFYSGSASVVEWMLEMSSPKDVLNAQIHNLSTPQQWQLYIGEPMHRSRQRFDEWFVAKYATEQPFTDNQPHADAYVAGDFECPPCHSFLEYAKSSKAGRKFEWHIHRLSKAECQQKGLSVPFFAVNGKKMDENFTIWHDVDVWAAKQLGLGKPHMTYEEHEKSLQPPPVEKYQRAPEIQNEAVEVAPGVTMTPAAIESFGDMLPKPTPMKPELSIEWDKIHVVVALSDANEKINKAVKGPSLRAFRRLSKNAALIDIIAESEDPARFEKYSEALGVDIDVFHVSVLIPSGTVLSSESFTLQKIETLLNATASNFSREEIRDIPVEIISEDLNGEAYEGILAALDEPDGAVSDYSFILNALAGSGAILALWGGVAIFRRKKKEPAETPEV